MISLRSLMALAGAVLIATSVEAMPAKRGKRIVKMPDGTLREAVVRGDERCHWLESPEGLPLSERVSSVPQQNPTPAQLADLHKRLASKRRAKETSMLIDGCFPTKGKRKLLALLVNFADTRPTYTQQDFQRMMNQEGYDGTGSFRDYYLQQSYGQLDVETTVTRWITLHNPKASYAGDMVTNLIYEALSQIDGEVNLADYDNDGDGVLDGLIVLHQGEGQEVTGSAMDIWSHSSTIYGMQFDGITVYRYTIEPELYGLQQMGIGVVCHEFGHNLGASDYYDSDYAMGGSYGGTGRWDIMGSGGWNGPEQRGDAPAPFSAWQKVQFGWMQSVELSATTHIKDMQDVGTHPVCYRMNTGEYGDYFILENRQPTTPWDSYTPGHGLLLTHAIESVIRKQLPTNQINATYPQGLYTVCADAATDPEAGQPSSYGDPNRSTNTFPSNGTATRFADDTSPSCRAYGGRLTYASLENITEEEQLVSFDYVVGKAPQRPLNFSATVQRGEVHLNWEFPTGIELPESFNLRRNGELIARTHELAYVDREANVSGLITYTLDATYADGLVSGYESVQTRIPVNKASDLRATVEQNQLLLQWSQPTELSRCVDNQDYNVIEHLTSDFCYAHRFRAEDLLPYIGYKVRGISFIPNQTSINASFKVCVWRMTEGGMVPELVCSRNVSEFSPTYKRSVLLTSQPTIEPGYEYWIGVQIQSTNRSAVVIVDQSELIDGYGNWMNIGNTSWMADPSATGNYILAATLSVPTSAVMAETIPEMADCDYDIDLYYPLGYGIYTDGEFTGSTTSTSYKVPLDGRTHQYSVVSIYKGGNESQTLTLNYAPENIILPMTNQKHRDLYDLSGRKIYRSTQHGIYINNKNRILY